MRNTGRGLALVLMIVFLPAGLHAQATGTITGRVTAQEGGAPLPGVQIQLQGTQIGTITAQDGRYQLTGVPSGPQTVTASLINREPGNLTLNVVPGQSVSADFVLASRAIELEGVVVNAITGQRERKREVGTNVATIQVDEIEKGPITKVADVLTGRTAGVNLQGVSGGTGTSQRIRIRGANSLSLSNEPLIYVDGVRFSNSENVGGIYTGGQDVSRLNDLNPEDIESVEVLKGPAASALYGTAAANGVLLIQTKQGRAGKAQWHAFVEGGLVEDNNDYPTSYLAFQVNDPNAPLLTSAGRLNVGTSQQAAARTGPYVACPNLAAGAGLCRQDRVESLNFLEDPRTTPFSTGSRRKIGLSVSGGSDALTYYVSGDTENEEGVIYFNTLDKQNVRANFNARPSSKLTLAVTTGYTDSELVLNLNDDNIFSPLINGLVATPVFIPGQDTLGTPGTRPGLLFGNSLADIAEYPVNQEIDRFVGGINSTYTPFPWLSGNASIGLDFYTQHSHYSLQPGRLPISATFTPGRRYSDRANNLQYTGNGSLSGQFDLSSSVASTSTVGVSYARQRFEGTSCFGVGIVEGTRSCGATSSLFEVDEAFAETITLGGFFQQQLAISDRIFLAGSVRGDDNSAFGQNFGLIYYPSASVSWVISEEPFFPALGLLSNLRLRAAYGQSGLRPNFRDAITLYEPVAVADQNQDLSAVTISRTGNEELKPERSTEYEFGADAGLFGDRLSAEFTYYNKRSEDALISRRLPPSFGLTSTVFDNLGRIRNSGLELGLNALLADRDWSQLNVRFSATTLDNVIEELGEGVEPIIYITQRHQEGFPAGAHFQRPIKYNDANGDGKLTREEVSYDSTKFTQVRNAEGELETIPFAYLGPSLPTNTQSLSADLTLFRFLKLSTLFERRAGNKQYNNTERFRCGAGFGRLTAGACSAVANPDASLAEQAAFIGNNFLGTSYGFIEDADFIKWREVTVRVGMPATLSRRFPTLAGASVSLSGRNLATWTEYTGIDPEINFSGSGGLNGFGSGEFFTQPAVRYLTARVDFSF